MVRKPFLVLSHIKLALPRRFRQCLDIHPLPPPRVREFPENWSIGSLTVLGLPRHLLGVSLFWDSPQKYAECLFATGHCTNSWTDFKSIDFVLAFPQADIDINTWMELPEGMIPVSNKSNLRLYTLKLNIILYGLKQASHNWYENLKQSLLDRYFTSSNIDPYIFMKDGMLLLV